MLHEAGIMRTDCHMTYVCQQQMPIKRGQKAELRFFVKHTKKYQVPKAEVATGKEQLLNLINELNPTLIIALGELSLWALTGEIGITKWRGSVLEMSTGHKVVPTYSPEVVCRKWDWRFICVQDLRRAEKESEFPEVRIPPYDFIIRPSFERVMETLDGLLERANKGADNK